MTKVATAGKRADAPLLGEAALQEALAGFGASPGANTAAATRRHNRRRRRWRRCSAKSPG